MPNIASRSRAVLIDNCVISLSHILQPATKEHEIVWGDQIHKILIAGYERTPSRSRDQFWLRRQIECLPTIARLAKDGTIECYIYNELRLESWLRPGSFPALPLGFLFNDVSFHDLDAAVERSYFFSNENFVDRSEVIGFCKFLLHPRIDTLINNAAVMNRLPVFQQANLRSIQRFRDLCKGLSEKRYPDAFHLWTAESNKLEFFLTTDRKFLRAMRETKRMALPCKPVSPDELVTDLGITELEPFPFELNQFYTIWGTPG